MDFFRAKNPEYDFLRKGRKAVGTGGSPGDVSEVPVTWQKRRVVRVENVV